MVGVATAVMPSVSAPGAAPAYPGAPAYTPSAGSPQGVVSPTDLRLIVREMIDQAVAPLLLRIAELERRPRAPSSPGYVTGQPVAMAAAPYTATLASPGAQPVGAAPVAARPVLVAQAPLLDVAAIERDVPMDMDMRAFDGGRRKRRNVMLFVFGVLVLFGGLFAMLAESYTPHP
jgi:hypothetical protein